MPWIYALEDFHKLSNVLLNVTQACNNPWNEIRKELSWRPSREQPATHNR